MMFVLINLGFFSFPFGFVNMITHFWQMLLNVNKCSASTDYDPLTIQCGWMVTLLHVVNKHVVRDHQFRFSCKRNQASGLVRDCDEGAGQDCKGGLYGSLLRFGYH